MSVSVCVSRMHECVQVHKTVCGQRAEDVSRLLLSLCHAPWTVAKLTALRLQAHAAVPVFCGVENADSSPCVCMASALTH